MRSAQTSARAIVNPSYVRFCCRSCCFAVLLAAVEDIMKQPCCAFLVAEESCSTHDIRDTTKSGSRIVGCVEIDWSGRANCGGKRPGVDAIFGMLSVKSEHLRRGIGQLLVASAGEKKESEHRHAAHRRRSKRYYLSITNPI